MEQNNGRCSHSNVTLGLRTWKMLMYPFVSTNGLAMDTCQDLGHGGTELSFVSKSVSLPWARGDSLFPAIELSFQGSHLTLSTSALTTKITLSGTWSSRPILFQNYLKQSENQNLQQSLKTMAYVILYSSILSYA